MPNAQQDSAVGRRHERPDRHRRDRVPARREAPSPFAHFLDEAHGRLQGGAVDEAMQLLHEGLHRVRWLLPQPDWKRFGESVILRHPIRDLLHRDWFTYRAFEKPRGYPGDAELLDFLYQDPAELLTGDRVGGPIGRFMHAAPSARSVRWRRDMLTARIDQVARERPGARILSVACGHLREAQRSRAVLEGQVGELIAFDQDTDSLAVVDRELGRHGVRTVQGNVRSFLEGKAPGEELDFAYSAGLYDYLSQETASRLTGALFCTLRPGGRLLVANFVKHPPEAGYMETFMDWWLVHRDAEEMEALRRDIPPGEVEDWRVFPDAFGNVLYLELRRR
jgi:hypothetical protein